MEQTTMMKISKFQLLCLVCVMCVCRVSAQLPPSFGNNQRPVVSSSPNCNYLLSAGTPGSCVITTVDVERKLDLLKDSMARERLQFVAHNSLVQQQLTDLKNRDQQFSLQIDGLRRDLRSLSARGVSSSVPSTGASNANLQQLRSALTQAINTVDNKLTNLSVVYQRDAVSQSRVNSALQSQLTQVLRENTQLKATTSTLSLQLQQLATQLRGLAARQAAAAAATPAATAPPTTPTTQPPTTPTTKATQQPAAGPTVNPAVINSILQSIKTLTTSSNKNAADIGKLNNLQSAVTNNSNGIVNTNAAVRAMNAILTNTTQKTNGVYNWLQNFQQSVFPGVQNDITNIKAFSNTLSQTQKALLATVSGLQNDFIVGQARQDQAINDLAQGITSSLGTSVQIRTQLNSLQQKVKNTLNPQPIITPPLVSSKVTRPSINLPPTLRPRPGK